MKIVNVPTINTTENFQQRKKACPKPGKIKLKKTASQESLLLFLANSNSFVLELLMYLNISKQEIIGITIKGRGPIIIGNIAGQFSEIRDHISIMYSIIAILKNAIPRKKRWP